MTERIWTWNRTPTVTERIGEWETKLTDATTVSKTSSVEVNRRINQIEGEVNETLEPLLKNREIVETQKNMAEDAINEITKGAVTRTTRKNNLLQEVLELEIRITKKKEAKNEVRSTIRKREAEGYPISKNPGRPLRTEQVVLNLKESAEGIEKELDNLEVQLNKKKGKLTTIERAELLCRSFINEIQKKQLLLKNRIISDCDIKINHLNEDIEPLEHLLNDINAVWRAKFKKNIRGGNIPREDFRGGYQH